MKTSNTNRTVRILAIVGLLFAATFGVSPAAVSDGPAGLKPGSSERSVSDARLIIRRTPNLGNHVIVDLYIDGKAVLPVVYGQTYESLLTPGRHLLSVVASPSPIWPTPSKMVVNLQQGQTYSFTAIDDGSGNLILKGG